MKKGFIGIMEMFASFVVLNVLLFCYSLFLVTFIPALAAAIEIMHKWKHEGLTPYFLKNFHSYFKKHAHRKSTFSSGIWIAGAAVLAIDACLAATISTSYSDLLYAFSMLFLLGWVLMVPYITIQLMKVELNPAHVFKNSFFLLWIEWKKTLAMLLFTIALAASIMILPFLLILAGSLVAIFFYSLFLPIISTRNLSTDFKEVLE